MPVVNPSAALLAGQPHGQPALPARPPVADRQSRNFVRLASTNKVLKYILTLLSERFELHALMEHPQGGLGAQKLGIKTSKRAHPARSLHTYMLRVTMLRLLIVKFGAQLKEIQISPEHGDAYVKELRSYYFIHYGAQGVSESFLWGGRITVRPVVRI